MPLPKGLGRETQARTAELLRPEWISATALATFETLELGEATENRILGWLLDGTLAMPSAKNPTPLAVAAKELLRPTVATGPAELGRLAAVLYRYHWRFMAVAPERWPERLEMLATTELSSTPPDLSGLLERDGEEVQWLVIDALGLPMVELLESRLTEWLPQWRLERLEFARVGTTTDTDAFFAHLLERGINHPLEKINALDRLLHDRNLPFADLERMADAEIRAAARSVAARLDPARSLRLFADHGFRISQDGRNYEHGGDSTLERVVPLLSMVPL